VKIQALKIYLPQCIYYTAPWILGIWLLTLHYFGTYLDIEAALLYYMMVYYTQN